MKFTHIYYYFSLNLNFILLSQFDYIRVTFKIERHIIFTSKGGIIYFKVCRINDVYVLNTP